MAASDDRYSAYSEPEPEGPGAIGYFALVMAWVVPGLGHMLIGQWRRGILFMLVIHLLFGAGMLIAGIRAINPAEQQLWTYTQLFTGWPMLVANQIEKGNREANKRISNDDFRMAAPFEDDLKARKLKAAKYLEEHPIAAYHPKVQDMGAVYCGIAGMLNLLVIFDVLLRITGSARPDPSKRPAMPPAPVVAKEVA